MLHSRRSKLLGSACALFLTLAMSACSGVVDLDRWDWNPAATAESDAVRIAPIMRVAHATRAKGDVKTAASLYRRAHELAPDQVEPLVHLGFTLNQVGASAQAAEAFRRALVLDPENPQALRGLGLAFLNRNQIDMALERFYKALHLEEDVRLYNAIGVAYDMKGDHNGAQTHYYLGLDVDPQNVSVRTNLGLSLSMAGYYGDAVRMLDSVARDPRATPEHRKTLALAYGLAGDADAAGQVASIDFDEATVQRNLRYYEALRAERRQKAARS